MKAVLITGAAGGIGQALVRAFAETGHVVIGSDVADPPDGLPCERFIACDLRRTVSDESYATQIFSSIRQALNGRPLAALINNAAVQILGRADALSREDWQVTLETNLVAPFLWAQAFLAELEAAHGMVLNMSSIHARLTKPNFVAYATSKAALSGMTRAMAVELGGRVRVNAIEPAAIATPMLRAGFAGNENGYQQLNELHPSGNVGSPDELANLARLLIVADNSFLNGAVLGLDGGIGACLVDPSVVSR